MTRLSDEELNAELQEVVAKHNDAVEVQNKCKTRFTEIQAILADRKAASEEAKAASEDTTST